jgi:hypothetical protein
VTVRRKKADRAGGEHEVYETPAWCVRRLLEAAPLPSGKWLEPCAGSGNIIRAVRDIVGYAEVSWTACEIREECRAALEALDVAELHIGDFLVTQPTDLDRRFPFDVIVTNCPFTKAAEFIEACRAMAPLVAMLLPIQYFSGAKRVDLFAKHMPSTILQLPDRPQFIGDGSNSIEYGWWIWEASRRNQRGCWFERLALTPPEERGKRPKPVPKAKRVRKVKVAA